MVLGHAMCPTKLLLLLLLLLLPPPLLMLVQCTRLPSMPSYPHEHMAMPHWKSVILRVGRWQKVNLSIYVRRIEYGRCICVCRSLSHTPFRSFARRTFFSRSHFLCRSRYLSLRCRTIADAHETQCEDERVNKTLCAYLQANIAENSAKKNKHKHTFSLSCTFADSVRSRCVLVGWYIEAVPQTHKHKHNAMHESF